MMKTPSGISSFLCVVNQSGKIASGARDSFLANSYTLMPELSKAALKSSNSFYACTAQPSLFPYLPVCGIGMHAAILHELVVLLTVLILIEDLRPDDDDFVSECWPGHLAAAPLTRTSRILDLLCKAQTFESDCVMRGKLVRGGCASFSTRPGR